MSKKVVVLLSSYNGVGRIEKQIESILNQQGVSVRIFVRDDGSTDGTKSYIRHLREQNTNIELLDDFENVGYKRSFLRLAKHVANKYRFDYFAFADQDDYWYPNKLLEMTRLLEQQNKIPDVALAISNGMVVENDVRLGTMYSRASRFETLMDVNFRATYGMSFLGTPELLNLFTKVNDLTVNQLAHDDLVADLAVLKGKIYFLDRSLMDYIQHGTNTSGYKKTEKGFLRKIKLLRNRYKKFERRLSRVASKLNAIDPLKNDPKLLQILSGNRLSVIYSKEWTSGSLVQDALSLGLILRGKI